ncbi:phage tail tip lysozyme [Apilactobacillus timberlakei]|uniref:phage tail tip lysozyme n=1 Tax=Apilactobacillus timberlakei TaxID=2008380 RepID=UPI001127AEEF|nr:phage tail tip lysozyme [Apilactobacillus timberlakei]TPR16712.1 M23 family peptidase [Apilactobacillus timberlakei]TPR21574.1 M23 family peptidase [Apilactobacillus timberlakei]
MNDLKKTGKQLGGIGKFALKSVIFFVKHWFLTLLIVLGIVVYAFIFALTSSDQGINQSNSSEYCSTVEVSDGAIKGGTGSWTKPGTKAYNLAQRVYEAFLSHKYSAAAAAGAVGNVMQETGSHGNTDQAEGYYGDDDKENGVFYGNEPLGSGGAGLFQFTKYTKFAPLKDKRWLSVKSQVDFIFTHADSGTQDIKAMHIDKITDPSTAALRFRDWEGGSEPDARAKNAQTAYRLFNHIKGDSGVSDTTANADAGADSQSASCDSDDLGNYDSKDWVVPLKAKSGIKFGQTDSGYNTGDQSFSGSRNGSQLHDGFDFGTSKYSDPIRAAHSGTVVAAGVSKFNLGTYNSFIAVQGGGAYQVYQEFGSNGNGVDVEKGQKVKSGQIIGHFANGASHTHFGLTTSKKMMMNGSYSHDTWRDPITFFNKVKAKE